MRVVSQSLGAESASEQDVQQWMACCPSFPIFWFPRRNFTLLTSPSLSVTVCTTLPNLHLFCSRSSAFSMIMSPTSRFLLGVCQRCLMAILERYSHFQRPQNSSARYWTWRHLLRVYISSFMNLPGGGNAASDFIVRRWFGVSGSGLFGWLRLSDVSGRSTFLTVRICLSHTPPAWLEWRAFKMKSHWFWARKVVRWVLLA